jgi:hypothetical protein
MNQPAAVGLKAAAAVAKAVTLRDLATIMEQLHQRDAWQNPYPLARDSRAAAQMAQAARLGPKAKDAAVQPRGTRLSYPVFDVTKLPDTPDDKLNLQQEFMNSPLCWMQLLPNHLEVSYSLVTGIYLWPPQEVFYPAFFDFDLIYRWAGLLAARGCWLLAAWMLAGLLAGLLAAGWAAGCWMPPRRSRSWGLSARWRRCPARGADMHAA